MTNDILDHKQHSIFDMDSRHNVHNQNIDMTPAQHKMHEDYHWDGKRHPANEAPSVKHNGLIMPFMMPFYLLSEKSGMYYHIYKEFTGALEKIFKERVFANNSPITGVTEAKIDEYTFAPVKLYQKSAFKVGLIASALTILAAMTSSLMPISILVTTVLVYILNASIYYDLIKPASLYTYYSKKFSDDRYPITEVFYSNYIKNFRLTERVYYVMVGFVIFLSMLMLVFKDTIEYTLRYDTGILTSFTWYILMVGIFSPLVLLVKYYFDKQILINKADMDREKLIEDILDNTKTNFDIARERLKNYR